MNLNGVKKPINKTRGPYIVSRLFFRKWPLIKPYRILSRIFKKPELQAMISFFLVSYHILFKIFKKPSGCVVFCITLFLKFSHPQVSDMKSRGVTCIFVGETWRNVEDYLGVNYPRILHGLVHPCSKGDPLLIPWEKHQWLWIATCDLRDEPHHSCRSRISCRDFHGDPKSWMVSTVTWWWTTHESFRWVSSPQI